MIRLVPLFLFIFLKAALASATDLYAEASLVFYNKVMGKSCYDISEQDFSSIEKNFSNCQISNKSSFKDLNEIAEDAVFQKVAERQLQDTRCRIQSVKMFSGNLEGQNLRANDLYEKLPQIKELWNKANKAYYEFSQADQKTNVYASYCRQSRSRAESLQCFGEVEKQRAINNELKKKWQEAKGAMMSIIASTWNGKTKTMQTFIEKLVKSNPELILADVQREFAKQIPKVMAEHEGNEQNLLQQSTLIDGKNSFDKLNSETKAQLVEEISTGPEFQAATKSKDAAILNLQCRLEGKYTKGREALTHTISIATLFAGGVAGILAKIPLAVRVGTFGQIVSKTRSAGIILGAAATGMDVTNLSVAVISSCFKDKLFYKSSNFCSRDSAVAKKSELEQLEEDNCVLNAAMSAFPAGILTASKVFAKLKPYLQASSAGSKEEVKASHVAETRATNPRVDVPVVKNPVDRLVFSERKLQKEFPSLSSSEKKLRIKSLVDEAEVNLTGVGYKVKRFVDADGFDKLEITQFPSRAGRFLQRYSRKKGEQMSKFEYNPRATLENDGSGAQFVGKTNVVEVDAVTLSLTAQGVTAYIKHELRHARQYQTGAAGDLNGFHGTIIFGSKDGNRNLGIYQYSVQLDELMTYERQQVDSINALRKLRDEIKSKGVKVFFGDPENKRRAERIVSDAQDSKYFPQNLSREVEGQTDMIKKGLQSSSVKKEVDLYEGNPTTTYSFGKDDGSQKALKIELFKNEKMGPDGVISVNTPAIDRSGKRLLDEDGEPAFNYLMIPIPKDLYQKAIENPTVVVEFVNQHMDKVKSSATNAKKSVQNRMDTISDMIDEIKKIDRDR